jgi:predicted methyltransferase MtxX (methanogen marker protein 4)
LDFSSCFFRKQKKDVGISVYKRNFRNKEMNQILRDALTLKYQGDIATAEANIRVYLLHPVGIGEHPQQLDEMDKLVDAIASAEDKIKSLNKHFNNTQI